jgi:hypothetical protein
MRIIKAILPALLLVAAVLPQRAFAADATSVRAILIIASNEKRAADPKLAAYEAELQRNVPESSFRWVGEGSASVKGNGHATITLGQGHRLEVAGDKAGGAISLKVEWMNGTSPVMSTTLTNLQPGVPTLLGRRPSGDGEVPIVLVITK